MKGDGQPVRSRMAKKTQKKHKKRNLNMYYNVSQIASELGVSGMALNKFLEDRGIIVRKYRNGRYRAQPSCRLMHLGRFRNVATEIGGVPHWQWNGSGRDFIKHLWRGGEGAAVRARGSCTGGESGRCGRCGRCGKGCCSRGGGYSVFRTYDAEGRLHSTDGRPARVKTSASGAVLCEEWFRHGQRHRSGPEASCGSVRIYSPCGRLIEKSVYKSDRLCSVDGRPCTERCVGGVAEYGYAGPGGNVVSTLSFG